MNDIEALLNDSIATEPYRIAAQEEQTPLVDLSQIDFDALQQKFEKGRKRTETEKLQGQFGANSVRWSGEPLAGELPGEVPEMIDAYIAGSKNIEEFFTELVKFAQNLTEEEKRGIAEGLTRRNWPFRHLDQAHPKGDQGGRESEGSREGAP